MVVAKLEKKIKISCNAKQLFGMDNVIGIWTLEKEIVLCHDIKGNKAVFKSLSFISPIRPIADGDNMVYMASQSKCLMEASISFSKKNEITVTKKVILKDVPENVEVFTRWGKTWFFVTKSNVGVRVLEHGPTQFGLNLTKCLHTFYNAIQYIPPHGFESAEERKLLDCRSMASELSVLLNKAEDDCKKKFPTLNVFNKKHGSVATDTLKCLDDSIEAWNALCSRLDYFDPTLKDSVVPHTVMNESIVEHQFGFTVKKGQSTLQSMQEYVQNKAKHVIDFLIKMCEVPFNQDVKVKLRDKGYQHIHDTMVSKISVDELWEILNATSRDTLKKKVTDDGDEDAKTDEIDSSLYKAFLLTKSVPRKSNRAKWKEESGYAPNFLNEADNEMDLLQGDMVFAPNLDGTIIKLIVAEKKRSLKDPTAMVLVKNIEDEQTFHVLISSLILHKGCVAILPSNMFLIEPNNIDFSPVAEQMLLELNEVRSIYSDRDMALLPEVDSNQLAEQLHELDSSPPKAKKRKSGVEEGTETMPRKRKKKIIRSDEDDSNDDLDVEDYAHSLNINADNNCVYDDTSDLPKKTYDVGQWVITKFEFSKEKKINYFLCQIKKIIIDTGEVVLQFYREQIPSMRVFEQIHPEETHHDDVIVELVPKTKIDIMCGTKVKIMTDLNYRCV